jgi:hypothetical protein
LNFRFFFLASDFPRIQMKKEKGKKKEEKNRKDSG